jgi:hypothetical protein
MWFVFYIIALDYQPMFVRSADSFPDEVAPGQDEEPAVSDGELQVVDHRAFRRCVVVPG